MNEIRSTASILYDIIQLKGNKIPLLVKHIQSEPHFKKILQSNFNFKNDFCFLELRSYIGSHSQSVQISCYFEGVELKETIYVDGTQKEIKNESLDELIQFFIHNNYSFFELY